MIFSSLTFIYVFLPAVLFIYYLAADRYRNAVLLAASLVFYAWGEPRHLAVMLFTIFVSYAAAVLIEDHRRIKVWILAAGLVLDLSVLGYFKYFNFLVTELNEAFGTSIDVIRVLLPLGISFYTFQALSYVIDVYRGDVRAQRDLFKVALYITLFPQLVAGPIVKYHDIASVLGSRTITPEMFTEGVRRFLVGLGKKVLIANNMGLVADRVFEMPPAEIDTPLAWIGAVAYSLQIFFDFAGYSDMAIGLGLMFGFRFRENFNYPYISSSITEFWRRWHISLSSWFKSYVYIPLGGNRLGLRRTCVNLLIVFAITGLWHGAEWTFILWGLWHGLFIVLEKITGWHQMRGPVITPLKHVITLFIVLIGWVLFRADNLDAAQLYLRNMFGLLEHRDALYTHAFYYDRMQIIAAALGIALSLPLIGNFIRKHENRQILRAGYNLSLFAVMILASAFLTAGTYNPFIYFRF